jgi:hypothetical protein
MTFGQREFDVRCEWGERGVFVLAPVSHVIIIVDVLSFSTSVDIAVSRGAMVYPYSRRDNTALAYATSIGAVLAEPRRKQAGYSLSPASLMDIPTGNYPDTPYLRCDNHLNLAAAAGLGANRLEKIKVLGVPIDKVKMQFSPAG